MANPLVTIIITTHNGVDFLPGCLRSVFSQRFTDFEVVFVDNASTDGSADLVEAHYPEVRVLRSEVNLGYGGGNNFGARVARGDFLVFLNHDTHVTEDFLGELVSAMEQYPSVGIAQSKILMASDPEIIETVGAYLTRTGMWVHPHRGELDDGIAQPPARILGACGTCMIIRSVLFRQLGGFDPDFIVYYDDADLSWRARMLGHEVVYVSSSVIYHWGSGTTKRFPSVFTVYHSFKNRLCSLIKLLGTWDLLTVLPVHLAFCVAGAGAYLLSGKPASALAVLRALSWNVRRISTTLRERRRVRDGLVGNHQSKYGEFVKPLPLAYFIRTSFGYVARW